MKIGIVGWRGMVGRVLMERMLEMGDFAQADLSVVLFSTSQAGEPVPAYDIAGLASVVADAGDLEALVSCDVVLTAQGGDYTRQVYGPLRACGWSGYWVDAASVLRHDSAACLVLDPVNGGAIDAALAGGVKTFVGANCTVSLLLLALQGLVDAGVISWVSTMTYQAISGAGRGAMQTLVDQMRVFSSDVAHLDCPLAAERRLAEMVDAGDLPLGGIGYSLVGNVLPWIDVPVGGGQSREEQKAGLESGRILGDRGFPVDGTCVRIGAFRSHSQALTVKMAEALPLGEVESLLAGGNAWVRVVSNERGASCVELTPQAVSGTLDIAIGRLRYLNLGGEVLLNAFTVGDQLLWGAAEPLRRMVQKIVHQ